jgi:hypothetical protein
MTNTNRNKTSIKYWEDKVYKRERKNAKGAENISPYFSATFCHGGKVARVCLQTPNKHLAAKRARDACFLLKSKGWAAMWAIYKIRKTREEAGRQSEQILVKQPGEKNQNDPAMEEIVSEIRKKIHAFQRIMYYHLKSFYGKPR